MTTTVIPPTPGPPRPPPGTPRPPPGADHGGASSPARAGRHPAVRAVVLGLGGLLTVVVIGVATVTMASVLVRTTERDTQTLRGRIDSAVLRVSGELGVTSGPAGRVHIERRSDYGFSKPEVRQTLEDGVLTVRVSCEGATVICDNRVDVELPPDVDVDVRADHAVIADVAGSVRVQNDGGTVELDGVTGPVDVRVGGGSVMGTDLASDDVRANAGAGAIELTFRRPPAVVDASAGAGHIQIEVPRSEEGYRVDASAGAGGTQVDVATDPNSDRTIRARAGAGGVEVRYAS